MIERELRKLMSSAKENPELRQELIEAAQGGEPMMDFCSVCRKSGFEIYPGELFAYGQDMNDSKLRSTNGGGNFEIDGWSDAFENLIDELRKL